MAKKIVVIGGYKTWIMFNELIDGIEEGGVAAYIDSAADSGINLFV